ncbi:MAG TPA: hypothetical protein VGK73_39750 [Polyangiaceae bacterium]
MPSRRFVLGTVILAALACDRGTSRSARVDAGPPPPSSSSGVPEVRSLGEAEVLALVRALPEFEALAGSVAGEGTGHAPKVLGTRVLAAPKVESTAEGARDFWEIVVAEEAKFEADGGLVNGEPPDLHLRIDPRTGAISVRDPVGQGFREYAAWAAAQRGWNRAAALVMTTPEWKVEASLIRGSSDGREFGAELGLVFGREPRAGCASGSDDCRYTFSALRICGGCGGGLWADFEVDPVRETVFARSAGGAALLPYGEWRHAFRAQARNEGGREYRALLDERQAFPEHRSGAGSLGYGAPRPGPATISSALRAALARGGFELGRVERYGGGFLVFVVQRLAGAAPEAGELRAWGAELVRANGGRACEVVADGATQRFQFDRLTLTDGAGGVYVFVDGGFHPWVAPAAKP